MRLALTLWFLLVGVSNAEITLFPDGSDSIGIPEGPYRGTCFNRCEMIQGMQVRCDVYQRFGTPGNPVDCAGHCRYQTSEQALVLPLPLTWRTASAGWCMLIRRTDTGEILYPASHCENYQMMNLRSFGPGDSECWYPKLPSNVPFEYVEPTLKTSMASRALSSMKLTKPYTYNKIGVPGFPGRLYGSYHVHVDKVKAK